MEIYNLIENLDNQFHPLDGWIMVMVMASFTVCPSSSLFRLQSSSPPKIFTTPVIPYYHEKQLRRNRGSLVVRRGGAPGASTYIFAFVFPLSLLAATIFTSIQISDKLDRDFYQELEVNQSILEAQDDDDDDNDLETPVEIEPTTSGTRNRPKREPEPTPSGS